MGVERQAEHRWLERLVGEWRYESEETAGPGAAAPGAAPARYTGSESVRSLDGVWVLCEGRGDAPGGPASTTVMTLGYDPARGRCAGTFVGSMMTHLWLYEGELDPAGTVLTLETEGPSFMDDGTTGRYRDVIELLGADRRVLTSNFLGPDGAWRPFMTTQYRRTA